jgi:uncharacterized protein (DUF4415 family)
MGEQPQNPEGFRPGDKIRVRSGPYKGARGIIQNESDGLLEIQIDSSDVVRIEQSKITNYSLAARRAWKVMPKRAGRPQLSTPRKKMVSIRLDIDVWERLGEAVESGLINSREEAVNVWLREKLDALPNKQQVSDS